MSDPLSIVSTLLIILIIVAPVLFILINLDRTRKRNDEMRDLQKETNRLLTEIVNILKNNP
jgi:large-conductance mechanosensitive channel